jgi:triacylglycerol esterase/lipase EstA (alpha/beta hydrolase family)
MRGARRMREACSMTTFSSRFTHRGRVVWHLFAVLVGLSLNMLGGVANAQEVAVSFSGILAPGQIDTYGVFGPKGGNLGNQPFSVGISYDASKLFLIGGGGCAPNALCEYVPTTSGSMTSSVTINGTTKKAANVVNDESTFILSYEETPNIEFSICMIKGYNQCNVKLAVGFVGSTLSQFLTIKDLTSVANGGPVDLAYSDAAADVPTVMFRGAVGPLTLVSPFLLGATNLANLDLANLLPKLSAADSALALAADGTSAAIVLFQTATKAPVTFRTNNGTTLLPYDPTFLTYAPKLGSSTLTVTPIQIGSLLYAVALLQAPPAAVTPSYAAPIVVTGRQSGGQLYQAAIPLVPPPVLLVHGLWGNSNSLSFYDTTLTGQAPWASNPNLVYEITYPGAESFASADSVGAMKTEAATIFQQVQSQGIVGARMDVVAHSMGGLLLRSYSAGNSYRSIENRQQGQFHTIVTLDTPEAGSAMASYLWAHQGDKRAATILSDPTAYAFWQAVCATASATTVAQCLAHYGDPVSGGAVQSLEPDSASLNGAPAPNIKDATWRAVTATTTSGVVYNAVTLLIRSIYSSEGMAPSIYEILGGPNDDIVSLASQLSGNPPAYVTDPGLAHTGLLGYGLDTGVNNSPVAAGQTACWLKDPMTSPTCSAKGATIVASDDSGGLWPAPGRLALEMPSAAILGKPLTLRIKDNDVRSFEIQQIGQDGVSAHDTVKATASSGGGADLTVIPRVLGKVQFHITANFGNATFDMAHPVVDVSVDPSQITEIRADSRFRQLLAPDSDSTFFLTPEITVKGLAQPVELGSSASYRVKSPSTDPAVTVDSAGRIKSVHPGAATIEVSFEGHAVELPVLVR